MKQTDVNMMYGRQAAGRKNPPTLIKKIITLIIIVGFSALIMMNLLYINGQSVLSDRDMFGAVAALDFSSYKFSMGGREDYAISEGEFLSNSDLPIDANSNNVPFGNFRVGVKIGFYRLLSDLASVPLYVKYEAGTQKVRISDFSTDGKPAVLLTKITNEMMTTAGTYGVLVEKDDKVYDTLMLVVDTTPPTAKAVDCEVWGDDNPADMVFYKNLVDCSPVKTVVENTPDFSIEGEQIVHFHLEDSSGNKSKSMVSKVKIKFDTTAPKIKGAKDRRVVLGDNISYKKGVTVTDNRDKDIALKVDSSEVVPDKLGTYNVTYSAVDKAGNEASVTVKFTVAKTAALTQDEQLENYVTTVIAKIIKTGMTQKEQARAIYTWTRSNIGYVNHADHGDYKKAAVLGFKNRVGDCYTYFSVAKSLLEHQGIDNIDIVKIKKAGRSNHFWSLINVGTGWYHFDATPRVGGGNFFMLTDKQLLDYSKKHKDSHDFDASLYPATPKS
ncbi:MAG: DUF5011 domain-containing protein [Oscillospiraceae bacterium]|jgi:hypothetical protein|nr:DUF5011 domain-containing protein [Oscillospiraceae bacterium]